MAAALDPSPFKPVPTHPALQCQPHWTHLRMLHTPHTADRIPSPGAVHGGVRPAVATPKTAGASLYSEIRSDAAVVFTTVTISSCRLHYTDGG